MPSRPHHSDAPPAFRTAATRRGAPEQPRRRWAATAPATVAAPLGRKALRALLIIASVTALCALPGCGGCGGRDGTLELLNVSYDPTRELYQELNPLFIEQHRAQTGKTLRIKMSHGGAGKQARAVMDGLQADVVTLALEYDINAIARKGITSLDWRNRLPHRSAPYTSTIVFLVRAGNPKAILDWSDLTRADVKVITPDPKVSGGARWNVLAAWAFAQKQWGSDTAARDYLRQLFANVPVLDTGARAATNTFAERGIGDVLLAWENEALLATRELGPDRFQIVYPSMSILAEPPAAVMDAYCSKHGTCDIAKEYLEFLYTDAAQRLAAKHHFRPHLAAALAEYRDKFPPLSLVTVDEIAGSWDAAQERFFSDGGVFDQIHLPGAGAQP